MKTIRSRVLRLIFVVMVCLVPLCVHLAQRFDERWRALLAAAFYITTAYLLRSRLLGYMLAGLFLGTFSAAPGVGHGLARDFDEQIGRLVFWTLGGLIVGAFVELNCAVSSSKGPQEKERHLRCFQCRRPIG